MFAFGNLSFEVNEPWFHPLEQFHEKLLNFWIKIAYYIWLNSYNAAFAYWIISLLRYRWKTQIRRGFTEKVYEEVIYGAHILRCSTFLGLLLLISYWQMY